MEFRRADRDIVRELARRVAEAAADPVMEARRALWVEHNSLRPARAMVLVFPEGAWVELLGDDALRCEDRDARAIERQLRRRIYAHEHFHDDAVVEAEWVVPAPLESTGWGLEQRLIDSSAPRGAHNFQVQLEGPDDLAKMHFPEVRYDRGAHDANVAAAEELFGDLLTVRKKGVAHVSFHLPAQFIRLRGPSNMLMDMVDRPAFVHEAMAFFAEGSRRLVQQYVDLNLLSLNNDGTYHSSGGNGYTDQLPAEGFQAARVRPCDLWASAEAQELAGVSPEMHEEFALRYERPLLEPFGLTGYGCCEDLTRKLDHVLRIPHIRRISISPWADVDACAERLGGDYILSWKPNPAMLVGRFDPDAVGDYLRRTVEAARKNGCVLEMVLKDTHTCEHRTERFDEWTRIARRLVEDAA